MGLKQQFMSLFGKGKAKPLAEEFQAEIHALCRQKIRDAVVFAWPKTSAAIKSAQFGLADAGPFVGRVLSRLGSELQAVGNDRLQTVINEAIAQGNTLTPDTVTDYICARLGLNERATKAAN